MAVVLISGVLSFDKACNMLTLGTTLLNPTLLMFLMVNCGSRVSIDRWIMQKHPNSLIGKVVKGLHAIVGVPSFEQFRFYVFCGFLIYGLVSFGAFLLHVADKTWLAGDTIRITLASSYFARFYEQFRAIDEMFPWFPVLFSSGSLLIQSIFQAFMIPLSFNKFGRMFVIFWGASFCFVSLAFLQLSYLPYVEIILWTALFYRPRWSSVSKGITTDLRTPKFIFRTYVAFVTACSIIFIASFNVVNSWPVSRWLIDHTVTDKHIQDLYYFGYNVPNVFNDCDLAMSAHWFVLQRNGDPNSIVPFNDYSGKRLWLHNLDIIYFSTSAFWRRLLADESTVGTAEYYRLIKTIADVDRRLTHFKGYYQVIVYRDHSNDVKVPVSERYKISEMHRYRIEPDAEILKTLERKPQSLQTTLGRLVERLKVQASKLKKQDQ